MLPADFREGRFDARVFSSHDGHDLLGVGTAHDRQFLL
jgi:hypothetical protein